MQPSLSFNNTQKAFSIKDDKSLYRSFLLFRLLHSPLVVKIGAWLTVVSLKLHLPIAGLVRRTIFRQFCAGESLEESKAVVEKLAGSGIGSILDYSVEGKGEDEDFERTKNEIVSIINVAAGNRSIPYTCVKLTGVFPHHLLEKLDAGRSLSAAERPHYHRAITRLSTICREAEMAGVPIYIDAEESWIQETIDRVTEEMMWKHNAKRAIVNTTIQMYRHDRLAYLEALIKEARKRDCFLGVKLVRGAYMEKENARAQQLGYASPIHAGKEAADKDYDAALELCLRNIDIVTLCAGTHNEASTLHLVRKMKELGLPSGHPHIYFSQLYGMSDNISFNLAEEGYNVTKYVPYGPVKAVLPYLIRRAQENSAIAGQMGRELKLIAEEMQRREQVKQLATAERKKLTTNV